MPKKAQHNNTGAKASLAFSRETLLSLGDNLGPIQGGITSTGGGGDCSMTCSCIKSVCTTPTTGCS